MQQALVRFCPVLSGADGRLTVSGSACGMQDWPVQLREWDARVLTVTARLFAVTRTSLCPHSNSPQKINL